MIRTVAIPRLRRLGDLVATQGCISYLDPNTGLWIADANTSADCLAGDGSQPTLPYIPGVSPLPGSALTLGTPPQSAITLKNSSSQQSPQLMLTSNPSSLPNDPGLQAALQLFAASNDPNAGALNQFLPSPAAGIAAALTSGSSSPIPGPGLGLVNIPMWVWIGLAAIGGIVIFGGGRR